MPERQPNRALPCVYSYPDDRRRILLQKTRYYDRDGKKHFRMEARKREGHVWVKPTVLEHKYPGAHDYFHSLLYGLDLLREALPDSDNQTVYWCEGEKDADSINALPFAGGVAVSHWQGARHATLAQARWLRRWRGEVVVCADEDEAGAVCAWLRYALLREAGIPESRIRVVRPAGEPVMNSGRDITEHLDDHYSLDDLVEVDLQKLEKFAARHRWDSLRGSGSVATTPTPRRRRPR